MSAQCSLVNTVCATPGEDVDEGFRHGSAKAVRVPPK